MNRMKNWQSYNDETYSDDDHEYQSSESINPILDQEEAEVRLCQVKSELNTMNILKKEVYHDLVSC